MVRIFGITCVVAACLAWVSPAAAVTLTCSVTTYINGERAPEGGTLAFTIDTETGVYSYPDASPSSGKTVIRVSNETYSFDLKTDANTTGQFLISRTTGQWTNSFHAAGTCVPSREPKF